jgi:hypothetical protein
MIRTAWKLHQNNWRVVRLDLPGAGAGAPLSHRLYNAGSSADVAEAVAYLHDIYPASPIFLVGFSLGGNIVLKFAGEDASRSLHRPAGVVALAPPIDLLQSSLLLQSKNNRLYERHYVRSLIAQVRRQWRFFPDQPRVRLNSNMSLQEFDDAFTAPRGGFQNALDYYAKASSLARIPHITVPTFLLTSKDDPFIAVDPFLALPKRANQEIHLAPKGGHLGFLGWDGNGGIRWAEQRLCDWLQKQKSRPVP